MPYIGRELDSGNYLKLDDISSSFNGSTTTFNLTAGGKAFFPGSAFSILVNLAGVAQEPEAAYQINNSQITFASAPASGDQFFCIVLGVAHGVNVPGNGTVNGAQLAKPFNYDGFFYLDDANNRVGVGTATPQKPLHVVGEGQFDSVRVLGDLTVDGTTTTLDTVVTEVDKLEVGANNNTVGVAITQSGTGDILNLYDGSTEVFSVADGGRVDVVGDIYLNSTDKKIYLTSDYDQYITANAVYNYLVFGTANQERLRIDSSGYVKLSGRNVQGSANGDKLLRIYQPSRTDSEENLLLFQSHATNSVNSIIIGGGDSSFNAATDITFRTANLNTTGGTERLRITSDGKVGIGTDDPQSQFEVYGTSPIVRSKHSTSQKYTQINHNGTDGYLDWSSGGLILRGASNAERLRIGSNGSVGIGTDHLSGNNSVYHKLMVVGDTTSSIAVVKIARRNSSASNSTYTFEVDSSAHTSNMSSGGAMSVDVNSGRAFTINGIGKVGIGTDSPVRSLDVRSGNSTDVVQFSNDSGNKVTFGVSSTQTSIDLLASKSFRIRSGSDARFNIATDGNVGINQSSPAHQLDVKISDNTTYTPGNFILNGAARLHNESTTTNSFSSLVFRTASGDNAIGFVYPGSVNQADFVICNDGGANGVERFRIDNFGRLGLGVVPEVFHSNNKSVIRGDGGYTILGRSDNFLGIAQNFYYDSSDAGKYIANGEASLYMQQDGQHIFCNAASGSANATASQVERLRITSGGDLGLGVSGGMNQAGTLYIQGGQGVRWTHTSDGTLYGDHYVSASGQHVFRSGSGLTERLRIDSSGNAKFISNARQIILRNDGSSGQPKIDFRNAADSGNAFAFINGATLDLQTEGTTRFHITSAGNIGIGTDTSGFATRLIVGTGSGETGMTLFSGTSSSSYIHFADGNSGADRYRGYVAYQHSDNSMLFGTNDVERLRITENGILYVNGSGTSGGTSGAAYTPVRIQGNDAATLGADVRIRGGATGYCHSSVSLQSTSNGNTGGNRGLGVYMYDEVSDIEWYAGRPYSGNDYYMVTRGSSVTYGNSSGQTAQHSRKVMALDNARRMSITGREYHFSDRAYVAAHRTSRIITSKGKDGTVSTCTVIINCHSYGSVAYDIYLGGYSNAGYARKGTLYINGALYGHHVVLNTSMGGVSHTFQYLSSQKIELVFSKNNGFVHPICSADVSVGGNAYLDPGDVSITWT